MLEHHGVFDLTREGPFNLDEASELVAVLRHLTQKYCDESNDLIAKLEALGPNKAERTGPIEQRVNNLIEEWNSKVRRLGGIPKGLWLVDIDAGDGYYCWKYPESEVRYWHDYKSGYAGRIPLSEKGGAAALRNDRVGDFEAL